MKQTDAVQLAFKREADPKGLLNPGKMIAWENPDYDLKTRQGLSLPRPAGGASLTRCASSSSTPIPVETSFNAALHRATVGGARRPPATRSTIATSTPRASTRCCRAQERLDYHDVAINREPVDAYVDRLRAAEALVLVFPVWNFGYPAILKGFFDRVFLPGVSFTLVDGKAAARPPQHPQARRRRRPMAAPASAPSSWATRRARP